MSKRSHYFIAHRGLSVAFPENTHAAFDAAWGADCDGIELDIQVTKDAKVIVFHDADTQRVTGQNHVIAESNWQDLQTLNVVSSQQPMISNESIPLLSDVVAKMPPGKIIQIEIKQQIDNMTAVIAELSRLRHDIEVQIISFDTDKLLQIRRELPHLSCYLVMDAENQHPNIEQCIDFAVKRGLRGLDCHYPLATPELVHQAHINDLAVATWTVNDSNVAQSLIERGVRYIASDIADEL